MLMVNIQELPVVTKILGLALKGEAKAFFFKIYKPIQQEDQARIPRIIWHQGVFCLVTVKIAGEDNKNAPNSLAQGHNIQEHH